MSADESSVLAYARSVGTLEPLSFPPVLQSQRGSPRRSENLWERDTASGSAVPTMNFQSSTNLNPFSLFFLNRNIKKCIKKCFFPI